MAQRKIVHLVDDIDGQPAAENVKFSLDGVQYEIDLTSSHAAQLRDQLRPYTLRARRTGKVKTRKGKTPRSGKVSSVTGRRPATVDTVQMSEIREWAVANGFDVADRGRLPVHVMEAWQKAKHGSRLSELKPAAPGRDTRSRKPKAKQPSFSAGD